MSDEILLEIVTPDKSAFSGNVEQVTIPGIEGQFGVLNGHAPLLTFVDVGELNFVKEDKRYYYAVNTGYVEVASNKVVVLVETAENADEIDEDRALRAKERALAELAELTPADVEDFERARAALMRAVTRLGVVGRG